MKKKSLKILYDKKNIYIISLIVILIVILMFYLNRKNYNVFLDLYMPNDSYGYIVYSPGNKNEFNLYKDSYLNVEYTFSDNKNRKVDYIISDNSVITIENNKIIAKKIGTTTIYIKTKDNIKSNIININVVNVNE